MDSESAAATVRFLNPYLGVCGGGLDSMLNGCFANCAVFLGRGRDGSKCGFANGLNSDHLIK